MRRLPVLAALVVLATPIVAAGQARRVEIILDVSGSMKAPMGSSTKIEQAKTAIRQAASGLTEGAVVAMRYYGHRVPQDRKAESCRDTELVVPFQPLDRSRFLQTLDQAVPRGQTPTAYSLDQAARDFGAASDEERSIVLVSDGEETCGGDPLATVRDLAAKGFKIKVHTIGFDVDAAARAQLESISRATGGEFHDARNAAALADSLRQVTQKALLVQRDSTFGEEIRGGNSYADAVPLKPGTVYRLDHHQRKDQQDYFAVDVKAGQKIVASIQAFDMGVQIDGEKVKEASYLAVAGIAVHGPDQQLIRNQNVAGPGNKGSVVVPVGSQQGGRFFVLVGTTIQDQHRNARFDVQLVNLFDAGSTTDAGSTDAAAVAVEPGSFKGFLYPNDQTDYFKLRVDPKATYAFRVRPANMNMQVEIAVLDRDGVEKGQQRAPNEGAAARVENITFGYEGEAFLRVHTYASHLESEYAAEITQTGGTPRAPAAAATSAPSAGTPAASGAAQGGPVVVGMPLVWLALGVVLLAGLAAVAYRLRKR